MLRHFGFMCCNIDEAVFFCYQGWTVIIMLVHVDDCTITATSINLITNFKAKILEHVKIMDLGKLHWLLGIKIK